MRQEIHLLGGFFDTIDYLTPTTLQVPKST